MTIMSMISPLFFAGRLRRSSPGDTSCRSETVTIVVPGLIDQTERRLKKLKANRLNYGIVIIMKKPRNIRRISPLIMLLLLIPIPACSESVSPSLSDVPSGNIRPPAVAGGFYPGNPSELRGDDQRVYRMKWILKNQKEN